MQAAFLRLTPLKAIENCYQSNLLARLFACCFSLQIGVGRWQSFGNDTGL
jgi:hypothetical protein